ncbi:unnamed protein product [Caenorhabditis brenneri]
MERPAARSPQEEAEIAALMMTPSSPSRFSYLACCLSGSGRKPMPHKSARQPAHPGSGPGTSVDRRRLILSIAAHHRQLAQLLFVAQRQSSEEPNQWNSPAARPGPSVDRRGLISSNAAHQHHQQRLILLNNDLPTDHHTGTPGSPFPSRGS